MIHQEGLPDYWGIETYLPPPPSPHRQVDQEGLPDYWGIETHRGLQMVNRISLVVCILLSGANVFASDVKFIPCSVEIRKIYNLQEDDSGRTLLLYFQMLSDNDISDLWVGQWYLITNKDGSTERYYVEEIPHTIYNDPKGQRGIWGSFVPFYFDKAETIHLVSMESVYSDRLKRLEFMYQVYPEQKEDDDFPTRTDINLDGVVNILDFLLFVDAFGSSCGMLKYDRSMDYNRDGVIDIADFLVFAKDFGKVA